MTPPVEPTAALVEALACAECGKPLTDEEREYYLSHCECCERILHARLNDEPEWEMPESESQPVGKVIPVERFEALIAAEAETAALRDRLAAAERRAERAEARIASLASDCPFTGRANAVTRSLSPEDPCPVCGDLGTTTGEPSRCVDTPAGRRQSAHTALTGADDAER